MLAFGYLVLYLFSAAMSVTDDMAQAYSLGFHGVHIVMRGLMACLIVLFAVEQRSSVSVALARVFLAVALPLDVWYWCYDQILHGQHEAGLLVDAVILVIAISPSYWIGLRYVLPQETEAGKRDDVESEKR